MYLSRSHTENIFPSWTVVVWRHHVYVPEFHRPSCDSAGEQPAHSVAPGDNLPILLHQVRSLTILSH